MKEMGEFSFQFKWWLVVLLLAFVIMAKDFVPISGEDSPAVEGRSLKVQTNDYGGPESNQKHQPKPKPGEGKKNPRSLLNV